MGDEAAITPIVNTSITQHKWRSQNYGRGPGVWVPTVGRVAAAGRPKTRSAVRIGRPGGDKGMGLRQGSLSPVMGVRGVTPRENYF